MTAVPEWRNWQTRQLEGLVRLQAGAGSSPVSGNRDLGSSSLLNQSSPFLTFLFVGFLLTSATVGYILLQMSSYKSRSSSVIALGIHDKPDLDPRSSGTSAAALPGLRIV